MSKSRRVCWALVVVLLLLLPAHAERVARCAARSARRALWRAMAGGAGVKGVRELVWPAQREILWSL